MKIRNFSRSVVLPNLARSEQYVVNSVFCYACDIVCSLLCLQCLRAHTCNIPAVDNKEVGFALLFYLGNQVIKFIICDHNMANW